MNFIKNTVIKLESNNYKAFYLSLFRILLAIFLFKEIIFKYEVWQLLYSNTTPLQFNTNSAFIISGIDVLFLKTHYLYIIFFYIISLLLFTLGIGKNVITFLCFTLLFLLQKINNVEVNGGDVMARFTLLCLSFSNCFEFMCIKPKKLNTKIGNLLSNLAALSIMLQLCLAYMVAFTHKIQNPYWQNGYAMFYVLQTEGFMSSEFNKTLASNIFCVYFSTYFTLFVEFLFPVLVWVKYCRKYVLIAGTLLHLGIYFLMLVNNLQYIFLLIYGLFIPNNIWIKLYHKVKLIFNTKAV
jgi:hypothetical protein